jgi:hypothetical protein
MFKMKRGFVVGLLVLTLIIAGCEGGEDDELQVDSVFEGGTQGLVASFEPFGLEESGVFTIFDSEKFPIEIVLKNKGEEDVKVGDATVSLRGISLDDFRGIVAQNVTNKNKIDKVTDTNPQGGEEIIDFTPQQDAQYKLNVTGYFQPDVFALVDYNYKTHLIVPKVCYKEDVRDTSVCELQGAKDFFVSGAPVTVTSVEQDVAGRGIIVLTIVLSNAGGGKATLPGGDFDARFDQVGFAMNTDPSQWECRSGGRENEGRFVDGSMTIICKLRQQLAEDTLFTKQVALTLNYKYRSIIQQAIKIQESVE